MGVTETILARGDGSEISRLSELTDGQMADVVVDATGSNRSMSQAMGYCAFGGRLVFVGITQQEICFPHAPIMHRRELTLLASRNARSADFGRIVSLIESGRIDTKPWISHRAHFDTMIDAFPGWVRPEAGVIKAMVEVS